MTADRKMTRQEAAAVARDLISTVRALCQQSGLSAQEVRYALATVEGEYRTRAFREATAPAAKRVYTPMQNAADVMRDIMQREPDLTDFGFGIFERDRGEGEYEAEFRRNREFMLEPRSLEQFERARIWLRAQRKVKRINLSRSSYGLKHVAEPDIGYVTNGMFIAAAIAEGFRIYRDSPNARFNIGRRLVAVPLPEAAT